MIYTISISNPNAQLNAYGAIKINGYGSNNTKGYFKSLLHEVFSANGYKVDVI